MLYRNYFSHCAIAGRIIGQSFTMHSDYTTRFVNFNPRNKAGEPDGYEAAALSAFHDDASRADYYGFTDYEGHQVFRYVAPMTIDEACLQCHGEPAGELDVTCLLYTSTRKNMNQKLGKP